MENLKIFNECHQSGILTLAITSDGKRVITESFDNTLKVWDLESGDLLDTLTGHRGKEGRK